MIVGILLWAAVPQLCGTICATVATAHQGRYGVLTSVRLKARDISSEDNPQYDMQVPVF